MIITLTSRLVVKPQRTSTSPGTLQTPATPGMLCCRASSYCTPSSYHKAFLVVSLEHVITSVPRTKAAGATAVPRARNVPSHATASTLNSLHSSPRRENKFQFLTSQRAISNYPHILFSPTILHLFSLRSSASARSFGHLRSTLSFLHFPIRLPRTRYQIQITGLIIATAATQFSFSPTPRPQELST